MRCNALIAFFAAAFSCTSYAGESCKEPLGSLQAVYECAEMRSPEAQAARLELEQAKAQVAAAGQWSNPELSAETVQGKDGAETKKETDISVGVPIVFGKISARKAVAEGGIAIAEAKLFETRARVRSEILLKLHRLRQVTHELEIVDEAISTFSKLINQYAKRPGLSPEQQVSYSVFQLSKSEYELKKIAVLDEILALDSFFRLVTGRKSESIKKIIPKSPESWPSIQVKRSDLSSPQQKLFQAELDTAIAELSVARSESWPTLTVGPSLKMQSEAGRTNQMWGLNLSLPLPFFNLNGGSRAAANSGVRIGESRLQLGMLQQDLKREELATIYAQSVKVLTSSLSHQEIEKRHTDAEQLFMRGLVPSSLVIEAHRTSFELEKSRHERELKALESLLGVYTIDGNILEVNL